MSIIILRNHFHAFRLAIYGNSILLFLIYFPISVSDFDLTFHPLVVIFAAILQRYRRQGIRQTPEQVLLTENFS